MTILQGTMQDGTVLPVQVDSQGRLIAEGIPGKDGIQLPPNPQTGDFLAWDGSGLAWVEGSLKTAPITSPITNVSISSAPNTLEVNDLLRHDCSFDHCRVNIPNISDGNINTYGTVQGDASNGYCHIYTWRIVLSNPSTFGHVKIVGRLSDTVGRIFAVDSDDTQVEIYSNVNAFTLDVPDLAAWLVTKGLKDLKMVKSDFQNGVDSSFDFYELGSDPISTFTFTNAIDLAKFFVGDAVTEIGNGDNGTGKVVSVDPATRTMVVSGGGWDVGSQVKGPEYLSARLK